MPKVTLLLALKFLTFFICSCIFYILSYKLFVNYFSHKVIVTSAEVPMGKVTPPAVMVCSQIGFRNNTMVMLTLDDYMENTINVTENILLDYSYTRYGGDAQDFGISKVNVPSKIFVDTITTKQKRVQSQKQKSA